MPTRSNRDHKNRWCFRCETWRDMEPWNIVDNGCRCRTCGYVVNEFLDMLECSVCGRMCEGLADDKGRLGCSYECAYKIGHVTRATMIERGRLKEEQPVRVTEPKQTTTTTYTIGETEWAQRIATLEHMLAEERENVDTLRARVAELQARIVVLEAMKP